MDGENDAMPVARSVSIPRVSKEELSARLQAGDPRPVIIDARLKYPYEHSTLTLPGARRLADPASLPAGPDIVVYDSDPDELVAERLAASLLARGHRVAVLAGGIAAWVNAKLPTDTKPAPQPKAVPKPGSLKG